MTGSIFLRSPIMLAVIGVSTSSVAQSQTRFNYQAVIRDASNAALSEAAVDIRVSIRRGSPTGLDSYRELHEALETSTIGLVTLLVGGADSIEVGDLDTISWGSTSYFLKIDADFGSGYADMGVAPIASVPIAEYARNGGKPWRYNANGIHYNEGNVGVGVSTPQAQLDVLNSMRISGDSLNSCELQLRPASNLLNNKFSSWDENGQLLWVLKMRDVFYGDAFGLYSEAANLDVLRIPPSGGLDVRANTNSKIRLYSANPSQENRISSYDESDDERWRINMLDQGDDDSFAIYSSDYGGSPLRVLHDGRTQAFCLEIMGGCDINERFNSAETLEPGTVVIADTERPGQVCTTSRPYDQRVVGAVSGANGIKPGITLTQEGTALDGTHLVALDGRVYVKVTGPVEVGDLLTTSNEPGRAMAVKNRRKAFGAVIGKALESDADGDGLVLMLVQPR